MSRFFRRADDSSDESSSDEEELLSQDESGDDDQPSTSKSAAVAARPMSRFLRTEGDEDSDESDSDEDEDEDDDGDDGIQEDAPRKTSRFLKGAPSDIDSDEENEKHVVKSARDKRIEELESSLAVIQQKLKINDWAAINSEFDKLTRLIQRQSNLAGATAEPISPVYLESISVLENALSSEKEKDSKKKMDATKARALNTMRQKIKKATKEFETEVKEYVASPDAYKEKYQATTQPTDTAVAKPKKKKKVSAIEEGDEEEDADFQTVGRGGRAVGAADIYKELADIREARGKKATNKSEAVTRLEHLHKIAESTYSRLAVLLALISARFDYNAVVLTHMPILTWIEARKEIDELLLLLHEESDSYAVVGDPSLEYDENVERTPEKEGGVVRIRGSIISFVERLDDEFTKSLQNIDPHGTDYIERLRDEKPLYELIVRAHAFFLAHEVENLPRVIVRRLEHLYSKPTAVITILEKSAIESLPQDAPSSLPSLISLGSATPLIRALCVSLYQTNAPLLRTRAMLYHVYHHAFMNDFHTARDLFLMSHLAENIQNADVSTQIAFNRAVVQLGLCAFRSGLIKEAQATLQDVFTTQRVKELLAQGVQQQRYSNLTAEQERAEKARQLPFHMHINTELLEAAFLVSSMLVEIPLLASIDNEEQKRKAISKPFRRLLDFADRQIFAGPPESTRDHIMQASKALQDGEWEKCRDLVQSIKIWSLMPEEASVKDMLARRIQEEGLRTYLFTYSTYYASLSLEMLARTFSLPIRTVTATVSKMIWADELAASLDQAAGTVVFHRVELSRVQLLSQTLSDRVSSMAEQNAKTLDSKLGAAAGGWGGDRAGGGGERGDREGGKKDGGEVGERRSRQGGGRGGPRGRGARFSQGLGGRVGVTA